MILTLVGADVVSIGKNTFMWVQITHFAMEAQEDASSVLKELIASPGYAHDYASPFNKERLSAEPAVHGRWWRGAIHVELFRPCSAELAFSILRRWASAGGAFGRNARASVPVADALQAVDGLLQSGDVFKLDNPGKEDEHEYGFVTGALGFHEFVVIDQSERMVHLIVASDD